jgi:chromatin remodeling complex protein RSC6
MVRTSKSSDKSTAPASTPAPAPAVEAAAPKPRAKKAKVEVAPAPTAEATTAPAAEAAAPAASDASVLSQKLTEFNAKLQQLVGLFSTVKNDFKTLEKSVTRELKNAQKASSKKRRNNGNRKPSGFIKPTRISDELAAFLGKTVGTEMARTEVSKEINAYITNNGLQDKSNGRKINPDAKLTQLLKLNKEDELTYFNLQRYMKHHFIKAEVVAVATA